MPRRMTDIVLSDFVTKPHSVEELTMKKSIISTTVLLVSFFLVGVDPVSANGGGAPVIMGYTDNQGNPVTGMTTASCVQESGGVAVTLHNIVLIRDPSDGPKGKFTEKTIYKNPESGAKAYRVFEKNDGTAYATATGPNGWKFGAANLDRIKLDAEKSIAVSKVMDGSITFHLKGAPRGGSFYAFNAVHVGSDGTNAWVGTEGTRYTVHNVNGKPMLIVSTTCQPAPSEISSLVGQWR